MYICVWIGGGGGGVYLQQQVAYLAISAKSEWLFLCACNNVLLQHCSDVA